jgi:hypothetical protein
MRIRTAAIVLSAICVWAVPTVAEASFSKQASSAQSASSGTLHPPTSLSTSRTACTLTLSWTPTVDAKADGYKLIVNGVTQTTTIAPQSSSLKFSMTKNANYSLTLITVYYNWTSSTAQAVTAGC